MFNKENRICCLIFTIIAGLLLSAGITLVFFSGLVFAIPVLLYLTLVIGILSAIFVVFLLFCNKTDVNCFCINNNCIVATIIGSIISSIFALTLTVLAPFSIAGAFLVGVAAFFLFANLVEISHVILCLLCTKHCR